MNKSTSNHAMLGMYMSDELPSTPPIIDQLVCYDYELLNCSVV